MSSGLYSTEKRDFDTTLDLTQIRPYGDTMNDGKVQMSFTLPVACNEKGIEAALQLARKMGFVNPAVAFSEALDKEFSFYVVYGATSYNVDYTAIKVQALEIDTMDMHECEKYIEENFNREVVMVGASTGTDAHTVGIDAIMNMKGYAGHYGLERYKGVRAYNLGSQVPNEEFIKKAADLLKTIETMGIFKTIEKGVFGGVRRPIDGGKGLAGVFEKDSTYFNPFIPLMLGGDR